MSARARGWTVRLTAAAEADLEGILRWTVARFGEAQARIYAEAVAAALNDLLGGPTVAGATKRNDILKGLFTLHVARKGRKGRHFVMFRVVRAPNHDVIEVLRLLHDAMDLQRHLPATDESTQHPSRTLICKGGPLLLSLLQLPIRGRAGRR